MAATKKQSEGKSTKTTRGRKSAFDREKEPYSVFPRTDLKGKDDDKGRTEYPFAWSYKSPLGGPYKKNQSLKDPNTGDSIYSETRAREVARKRYKELLSDKTRVDHNLAPKGSVDPKQLAADWFAYQEREKFAPTTISRNRLLLGHLKDYTSFKHCTDITTIDASYLMRLREQLQEARLSPSTRYKEGHTPREEYIHTMFTTLAALVGYATTYKSLPTHSVGLQKYLDTLPKYKSDEDKYHTPEQMAAIERGCHAYMAEHPGSFQSCTYILNHLYCGARLDEHRKMGVDNVRLEWGDKLVDGELAYLGSKTERADKKGKLKKRNVLRYQPLFGPQRRFLARYLEVAGLNSGDVLWPQGDGWADDLRKAQGETVKWKNSGKGRNTKKPRAAAPRDILKAICTAVGVEYLGFHAFRTTYINARVRMKHPSGRQMELWEVQDEVGHNSSVTKDVYLRPGFSHLPKDFEDLDWQAWERAIVERKAESKQKNAKRRDQVDTLQMQPMRATISNIQMYEHLLEEAKRAEAEAAASL